MPYESDWRAATTYTYLDDFGSMAFAWEFLRRNSTYRAAYFSIASGDDAASEMSERIAQRWGLRSRGRPGPARGPRLRRVAAAPQSRHCDCRTSPG
jgi:Family of unknown function (DUF6499)